MGWLLLISAVILLLVLSWGEILVRCNDWGLRVTGETDAHSPPKSELLLYLWGPALVGGAIGGIVVLVWL